VKRENTGVAGFWTEGPDENSKLLQARRDERLAPLRARLDEAEDPGEIAHLKASIAEVLRWYREEEEQAGRFLY